MHWTTCCRARQEIFVEVRSLTGWRHWFKVELIRSPRGQDWIVEVLLGRVSDCANEIDDWSCSSVGIWNRRIFRIPSNSFQLWSNSCLLLNFCYVKVRYVAIGFSGIDFMPNATVIDRMTFLSTVITFRMRDVCVLCSCRICRSGSAMRSCHCTSGLEEISMSAFLKGIHVALVWYDVWRKGKIVVGLICWVLLRVPMLVFRPGCSWVRNCISDRYWIF